MFLAGRSAASVGTADEWAPLTPSSRNRKQHSTPTPVRVWNFQNVAEEPWADESGSPRQTLPPHLLSTIAPYTSTAQYTASLSPFELTMLHASYRMMEKLHIVTELLNEAMDVAFLPALARETPVLFWMSLFFLSLSSAARVSSALSMLPRLLPNCRRKYFLSTLVYVVEPSTGLAMLQPLLSTTTSDKNLDERVSLLHDNDRVAAKAQLKSAFATLVFEDLPEAVIEVRSRLRHPDLLGSAQPTNFSSALAQFSYLFSSGKATPIFMLSLVTTLLHAFMYVRAAHRA